MSSFLSLIVLAFAIFNMAAGEIGDDYKDFLTLSEFTQFLEASVGKKLSPEEIIQVKIVCEMVDKNGDGILQLQEMSDGILQLQEMRQMKASASRSVHLTAFRLVDKNENGFLDMKEMRSFPGWKWLSKMTEDSLKNVLRHGLGVDLLGLDGQMDFEEYLRWLTIVNQNNVIDDRKFGISLKE